MRTILSAFVLSTFALAAPMVHADEAKVAAPATEKAPVAKKSSKMDKKAPAVKAENSAAPAKVEAKPVAKSEAKPVVQKSQPRRVRPVHRATTTPVAKSVAK